MLRRSLLLLALAAPAHAQTPEVEALLADLAGTWASAPEAFPAGPRTAWIRRTTTFTPTTEALTVEAFADEAMTQPLLTYDSGGPMTVVGPWEPVPGAYAVELVNDRSDVTIFTDAPAVWEAVGLGACPLVVGEAVDITDCASGPPFQVVDCVDLDLVLLNAEATELRLGAPGTNRCVERPEAASEVVFVRE